MKNFNIINERRSIVGTLKEVKGSKNDTSTYFKWEDNYGQILELTLLDKTKKGMWFELWMHGITFQEIFISNKNLKIVE